MEMEFTSGSEKQRQQNRTSYKNLAMACERYFVFNGAAFSIASATCKDHEVITNKNSTFVKDRSKLRREHTKYTEKLSKKMMNSFNQ